MTVQKFYDQRKGALKLSIVAGAAGLKSRVIEVPDIYRPGLVLSGYFRYFPPERIQVLGRTEITYLEEMDPARAREVLRQFFSEPLVCLVVTMELKPSHPLRRWADRKEVPLLHSGLATTRLVAELTTFLESRLSPVAAMHGTLVEVYGLGVLLLGRSGIGKSECALELVKRGHRMITDDLVEIRRPKDNFLVGSGDELIQQHMELRGLGIIDVKELFGVGSVRSDCEVQLAIQIEEWKEGKEYDRTGLDSKTYEILGVPLPYIELPVQPGRSLAIIIEVAAMNERLRRSGVNPAERFNERVTQALNQRQAAKEEEISLSPAQGRARKKNRAKKKPAPKKKKTKGRR